MAGAFEPEDECARLADLLAANDAADDECEF